MGEGDRRHGRRGPPEPGPGPDRRAGGQRDRETEERGEGARERQRDGENQREKWREIGEGKERWRGKEWARGWGGAGARDTEIWRDSPAKR